MDWFIFDYRYDIYSVSCKKIIIFLYLLKKGKHDPCSPFLPSMRISILEYPKLEHTYETAIAACNSYV
jgi:hypothetical protein